MPTLQELLKMLESPDAAIRNKACEELGLAPILPEDAMAVPEKATADPEAGEDAQRALALPKSPPPLTPRGADLPSEPVSLCPRCQRPSLGEYSHNRRKWYMCGNCGYDSRGETSQQNGSALAVAVFAGVLFIAVGLCESGSSANSLPGIILIVVGVLLLISVAVGLPVEWGKPGE